MAKAALILADGTVFWGESLGAQGTALGEVVFTTGMTGYQETLTDPSYYGQMVCQTFPLMGNYGTNAHDSESPQSHVRGYIVRHACQTPSNFRATASLQAFLQAQNIVGIMGIDTRALTRKLRNVGVMNGAIVPEIPADTAPLLAQLAAYRVTGAVAAVSCKTCKTFAAEGQQKYHVALYDYGCKQNIVRCLAARGCKVTVVPHDTSFATLQALAPDGIMLSNGPGDPRENTAAIANLQQLPRLQKPIFGICLGHQLLALAMGGSTYPLPFGHRGANQPVTDLLQNRTYITSQNHGYAVEANRLPSGCTVSHCNANDQSVEGLVYATINAFTVQFHPEACGGPRDTAYLFDAFVQRMKAAKESATHATAQ